MEPTPSAGLYESLLTARLQNLLAQLPPGQLTAAVTELANAESADRISRHLERLLARAIDAMPEEGRAEGAVRLAVEVLDHLKALTEPTLELEMEVPVESGLVLQSILRCLPDGSPEVIDRPLTPLVDTTVLTNAPGEPAVAFEVRAEVPSADRIDILIAFIRWSGVRNLIEVLRHHHEAGRPLRILTTTYTNSTEQRALDELAGAGAEIRVSYDVSLTRLHAKAWLFHRASGYSTAYIGSSNLTHSAQVSGLEWNVRVAEARNPDAIAKMRAVFESYWASGDFVPYDPKEFEAHTQALRDPAMLLGPMDVVLRPFQEELLDRLALSRHQGHHRNLLVSATGTGKTVMAAVDYARLRSTLARDRLLFVAHREEILDQSRSVFRQTLRDPTFGEKWVGGDRPFRFEHVFASIQSLNSSGVGGIRPDHFDVVIVDEFHHAAARSYTSLLEHVAPGELLGMTATPERADGLDVLKFFEGRIAAELRLWDAIDQQFLVPFDYFGINDGTDLREIPWKRGHGYDLEELTGLLTANHAWAHLVLDQIRQKIAQPRSMRALGFCVSVKHARFMAERFQSAGLAAVAVWGDSPWVERRQALADLAAGRINALFTVDLFNEGIDVPQVDTLLLLRPTESPTLFLQQLGRGLRRTEGKSQCTVLDFVGLQRAEFRYDLRFRALLGDKARKEIERQVTLGFPFLPAGCSLDLDPVAKEIVLASIQNAIPSHWQDKCRELRSLGDVSLAEYLEETGLELDEVYANGHSWTEMRRAAGLPTLTEGTQEHALLKAVGRMTHVDDAERLDHYRAFVTSNAPPGPDHLDGRRRRLLRMLVGSLTTVGTSAPLARGIEQLWSHPQVRHELVELVDLLSDRVNHLHHPLELDADIPLQVHACYSQTEILAAFDVGTGARPPTWQAGVRWDEKSHADLFTFTLDKSEGGFSPTTRYRDYAVSRRLIHWESQSATAEHSATGQRYIHHRSRGSHIVLFARLQTKSPYWCLGTARYQSHHGDRPISFMWELDNPLPPDLYTAFAAAVA